MHKRIIFTFLFVILYMNSYNYIYGKFDSISENAAIILDSDGSSILYSKNINKKIFPASTTKILTAILAIENLNLDSNITVSTDAINNVPDGSSTMFLKPGEIVTVRQLLFGLMLPSGSDAANVLAEAVSGSIPNFIVLMNKKLEELGCVNSHFTNPHGFHDNSHYSTAYDMATIMKYASNNKTFRSICETKSYAIPPTNKTTIERTLQNTDYLLSYKLDYTLGGKTGYTDQAGNVFICYSTYNDKNLICCVYGGTKNILDKTTRFTDVKMLLDKSFKTFNETKILDKNKVGISYIDKKTNTNYILGIDSDISCLTDGNAYLLNYSFSDISITGDIVTGKLSIHAENSNWTFDKIYNLKLIKKQEYVISNYNFNTIILYILSILLILLILLLYKRKKYTKKKKKLKRRKY